MKIIFIFVSMAIKTKDITPAQYAALKIKGTTYSNITKHLRAGNSLPGVIRVKNWSRFYTLEVPADLTADSFKEDRIKYTKRKQ